MVYWCIVLLEDLSIKLVFRR